MLNTLPETGDSAEIRHDGDGLDDFPRALYDRHGSSLLRYAAGLLAGDWHRAEDVLQEAAIRAWRHSAILDPTAEGLRPWLYVVVRNLVIDGHRARLARPDEEGTPDLSQLPAGDAVDEALTAQVLLDAMRDLTLVHREVLLHVHYLGRSVNQTARMLGVPPGTVKSRTYQAVRAMRVALSSRGLSTL